MAARRFGARARVKTLAREFDTPGEARWSVEAFGDDADTAYVHGRVVTGKRKRKRGGKIAVRWRWPGEPASVLYSAPHLFVADVDEDDDECYFCGGGHASSACATLDGWAPEKKLRFTPPQGGWRSFEAARTYARNVGLSDKRAWGRWCKTSGHLAYDIPAAPHMVKQYKGKWVSWGDWLGTGNVVGRLPKQFRSFADARAFARSLHLPSKEAWHRWCSEGKRPTDIPCSPRQVYTAAQGWAGWADFLGNELAEGEECAICLEPLKRNARYGGKRMVKLRGCGHRYHRGCIDNWHAQGNAKTCPHCRGPLD